MFQKVVWNVEKKTSKHEEQLSKLSNQAKYRFM